MQILPTQFQPRKGSSNASPVPECLEYSFRSGLRPSDRIAEVDPGASHARY